MRPQHTDIPPHKGLLEQIKTCNLVLRVRFPVKVDNDYEVIEAYRSSKLTTASQPKEVSAMQKV
ncbi:MAG: hypothetical protein R3A50_19000 [Saprospiraceae bacterium]